MRFTDCLGNQLMLEPHTPRVYVESPPTNDLPRQLDNRIAIEMSDQQRVIYLRPGDTICLEAEYHDIKILAVKSNEIQVKSSIQQPATHAGTTPGAPEDNDDDEDPEGDDDDLDLNITHSGDEDATSDTMGGPAIRETPSKPSRGDDKVLPTATGANITQHATESATDKRGSMQPQDDAESNIFQLLKGERPPTKYCRTPKQKRQIAMDGDGKIMESSDTRGMSSEPTGEDGAAIEAHRGETRSSPPKRKHSMTDDDEDDGEIPASTAPPLKRSRGRPTKASKATNAATNKVTTTKARRKHGLSPDLDPRSSAAPQSPGTPIGKAPNKILLSNSKFAKDTKAKSWLTKHGATISDDIPGKRANFVCVVGTGGLATTAKVLCSLALGKRVVTDQWIEDSIKADTLLDLEEYTHEDLGETAHINRGELLKGKTLFITDAQMKAYGGGVDNIKLLASAVGAWKVESGSVRKETARLRPAQSS